MDVNATMAQVEQELAELDLEGFQFVSDSYGEWQAVLAAALDTLPTSLLRALRPLTSRVVSGVEARTDLPLGIEVRERAAMAAWLFLVGAVDDGAHGLSELLMEPWLEQRHRRLAPVVGGRLVTTV